MRTVTDIWPKGTLAKEKQMAYRALIDRGTITLADKVTYNRSTKRTSLVYKTELDEPELRAALRQAEV